ncbi:hypothetical protein N0V83_008097 [Neocucurbitaria cava]|uniref:Uncharacterized protein n=1 Tax=Neocucurbitaria cava TaxID=798079 RepID=A0A9W8Y4E7_9PLEO|nr:hypothetical protein N0V83_008097 [Neocucurbitaria cava]
MNRPSSAAMARTSSYPDFNPFLRNVSNIPSPDEPYPPRIYQPAIPSNKENHCNRPPSQLRFPTPYPQANRVPTPNPFAPRLPTFGSDVSMRDPSSVHSSLSRFGHGIAPPPPLAMNNVKSRKEGRPFKSPKLLHQETRHDKSLLATMHDDPMTPRHPPTRNHHERTAYNTPKIPASVEIIDVDAIDPSLDTTNVPHDTTKLSPAKSSTTHKAGMSSTDSTARLERQLYSALGDELGSFEQQLDTAGMGPELAKALGGGSSLSHHSDFSGSSTLLNPSASDFEPAAAAAKRKRRGTLGGERDKSPMSKREKGGGGDRGMVMVEAAEGEVEEMRMPRLRGD